MFSEEDANKIDEYLHKNFNIIYDFKFNGLILLLGGAVKDLIMGRSVNDLDFTLLTQGEDNIKEFLDKYKIKYTLTPYRKVYRFFYNGIQIDINKTDDLYYTGNLSTDMLFYDIKNRQFIPIGIRQAIEKNEVIDYYYQGYFQIQKRIRKAKKFINYINKNNENVRVKYKYNRFIKLLIAFLKDPLKILKLISKEDKYVK